MALFESPPAATPSLAHLRDDGRVVQLRGEYDVATVPALSETLGQAIGLDDADLVVDMRDVSFIDAATIGVMVRARIVLRDRSRSLLLRSPTPFARRLLGICDLESLIEPDVGDEVGDAANSSALASWVAVPAAAPVGQPPGPTSGDDVSVVDLTDAIGPVDPPASSLVSAPRVPPPPSQLALPRTVA